MNCWFISTFIYLLNITHENIFNIFVLAKCTCIFRDQRYIPLTRKSPSASWARPRLENVGLLSVTCDTIVTPDTGQWQWPWLWLMPSACGLGTLQISDKIDIDPRVGSMLRQTAAVIRSWHAGLSWLLLHRARIRAAISQSRRRPLLGPSYFRFHI